MIKRTVIFPSIVLLLLLGCNNTEEPTVEFNVENLDATIDENPPADQLIGQVRVNPTGAYSFSLSFESVEGAFKLDPETGQLRVLDPALFDFETNPIITGEVAVTQSGVSKTGQISVNLNDVDENTSFTIWDGPDFTFVKADGTDPSQEANQDRITADVWITRGTGGGQIYNAASEAEANKSSSPAGTKWAIGSVGQISSLNFQSFRDAVGSPKDVVGKDLVLYLEAEDAYLTVKFSAWSVGDANKGGFAYTRSTN